MKSVSRYVTLTALLGALSSCSLIDPRSRPDPDAEGNVRCLLVYDPCAEADREDLRFIAVSSPYRADNFNLSLPDGVLHAVFAPGRHLIADADVAGANCQTQWRKGHRLSNTTKSRRLGAGAVQRWDQVGQL